MGDRELMQQALDALEYLATQTRPVYSAEKAIEALRARLAQPDLITPADVKQLARIEKLVEDVDPYTAPPQREWQTLTDDEIRIAWGPYFSRGVDVARVIEALLKRKNT